ncbi:type IV secretory system conjugative DNA transfer family protein [Escherichia coli]|nr:type IV secretory system conjugative DNA transfer family protein [Escherichia coli]
MDAKKTGGLILFLLLLLVGVLIASNYLGGYTALRYSSVDISLLKWDTFHSVISTFSGNPQYKKLVFMAWIGFSVPLIFFAIFMLIVVIGIMPKKVIYGDARLATDMDLSKSGFFPDKKSPYKHPPILIGKMFKGRYKKQFIYFAGQQFLILYAPTRSGKGVGIVIPNCVNYPGSMVILDIKLENWFLSAGFRQKELGQECFLFAPAGYAETIDQAIKGQIRSHRWNPLDCVSRSDLLRETDLAKIAAILIPASDDPIWSDSARNLFVGLGLYLLDKERFHLEQKAKGHNVPDVLVSISAILKTSVPDGGKDLAAWMGQEIENRSWISDKTKSFFFKFMSAPDRTRGSIETNFSSPLSIFSNPITAEATNFSDFDIRDIRKKPMSIYLGLTPDALITHEKIVNLFFSLLVNENCRELPEHNPDLKYQCLILLDEFTSMGKSEVIERAVGFTAGYNLRFMFILQNEGQGQKSDMYGQEGWTTFTENSAVVLYYPPKSKNALAKKISEEIGVRDMKISKRSISSGGGKGGSSRTRNDDVIERPVLLPEEIMSLRDKKNKARNIAIREIITSEFSRPFIANKIIWFEEPEFKRRVDIARNNHVDIPNLFTQEVMDEIAKIAEIYLPKAGGKKVMVAGGNVITNPDLDNHDKTDVSE